MRPLIEDPALIEDPEWLQLRQEELLAIEDCDRDLERLLTTNAASGEEFRWYANRFKENILHLENVRRQMAHLHLTYSPKVEVSQTLADCGREVSRVAQEFDGFKGLV